MRIIFLLFFFWFVFVFLAKKLYIYIYAKPIIELTVCLVLIYENLFKKHQQKKIKPKQRYVPYTQNGKNKINMYIHSRKRG